ncbi:MAG: RNA methyltransferase [bacterium]
MSSRIQIVLVETTHAGNIGAVARAMKNMGLAQLVLVNPRNFPSEDAIARASGADDVLESAVVVSTLDEAISDSTLVIGASARLRTVEWPQLDPRECAETVIAHKGDRVSLVFGRESSGLTNAELERCGYLVHIPANPEYCSLNVAMAVQVITYEIAMAMRGGAIDGDSGIKPVNAAEMQGFFDHLEQTLYDVGFADPRRSDKLMRRLKRLFHRAAPDSEEMNILRGVLSAAQGRKSMRRNNG